MNSMKPVRSASLTEAANSSSSWSISRTRSQRNLPAIALAVVLARGNARERIDDRLDGGGIRMAQNGSELRRCARIPLPNLGQGSTASLFLLWQTSLVLHQCRGQRHERSCGAVARPHHRDPPNIHILDDARRRQPRDQAGAGQGGFSRSARTNDQQIRRAPACRPPATDPRRGSCRGCDRRTPARAWRRTPRDRGTASP